MRGLGVAASSWQLSTKATIQPTRRLHPRTSHRYAKWRLRTNPGSTVGVAWGASHGSGGHSGNKVIRQPGAKRVAVRGAPENRCVSFARVTTLVG